jgi:hypothetical protein
VQGESLVVSVSREEEFGSYRVSLVNSLIMHCI